MSADDDGPFADDARQVAVVVSGADGIVLTTNRAARTLLGAPAPGQACWQLMRGAGGAAELPCRTGCTRELYVRGVDDSFVCAVRLRDHGYTLCCAPGAHAVVTTLIPAVERPEPWEKPTPREVDVLRLLAEGLTNHEIAAALGVKERTVRAHVENLRGKLGAPTRAAIIARAFRMNLLA
jgi:DNA-binding CsgD family transcriptional regulator